jgi:hypothetical protein
MKQSILTVLAKLDTYWTVIEAELSYVLADIDHVNAFQQRYGLYWEDCLTKLNKIKREKEALLRDIRLQMELFHLHVESGRVLVSKLETLQPLVQQQDGDTYAVVSKILAHAV